MPSDNSQQLQDILNGQVPSGSGSSSLFQIPSGLVTVLAIASIVVTVLSILIMVFYLMSLARRWKVQSAILDIQKQVHEMNERQRTQLTPAPAPVIEQAAPNESSANDQAPSNDD